jgi:hypothetical protein
MLRADEFAELEGLSLVSKLHHNNIYRYSINVKYIPTGAPFSLFGTYTNHVTGLLPPPRTGGSLWAAQTANQP